MRWVWLLFALGNPPAADQCVKVRFEANPVQAQGLFGAASGVRIRMGALSRLTLTICSIATSWSGRFWSLCGASAR
jgi:hypothetical protein